MTLEQQKSEEIRNRAWNTLRLTGILIIAIIFIGATSNSYSLEIGIPCMIHEIFKVECPGCGITRMIKSLLQFDIYQAFRYNPFIFVTSPLIIYIYISGCKQYIMNKAFTRKYGYILMGYAIAFIIFGIIRNIQVFSWLKPTIVN